MRNIDRALGYGELIPRRHRSMIERYLTYANERTRVYAALVIARDAEARRETARQQREQELAFEAMAARDQKAAAEMASPDAGVPFDDDPL